MQNLVCDYNMELMIVITVICISLPLLQTPCTASLQIDQVQQYYSHEKVNEVHGDQLSLPRKLRFTAEVTVKGHGGDEDTITHNKMKVKVEVKEDVPAAAVGNNSLYNKEPGVMHGSSSNNKGTWQEWGKVEGGDTSQYFTMDYSHVKRRRPIHNK